MPVEIRLINSDQVALVDEADADLLKGYVWWEHVVREGSPLKYAYGVKLPRLAQGERVVKMHRLILGLPGHKPLVDHVNGNGLDNQRSNLQIITTAQNIQKANFDPARNPKKIHTKYRGVSYLGWYGKYLAYINCNGKRQYLGYYATAEEAARVRDAAAKVQHGKFARLNFEDDTPGKD